MRRRGFIALLIMVVCCILHLPASAQPVIYRFEQIDSLQRTEKRNVVIFIHTDWCKYCRMMEQITLKDATLTSMLNERYYFVSLDAEEKQDIYFNNRTFKHKPSGLNTGINELAADLGTIDGQLSYPGICILNPRHEIIFSYNQYLSAKDLITVLRKVLSGS